MPVPWDEQPEGDTSPMEQEIAVVFFVCEAVVEEDLFKYTVNTTV